MASRPLAVKQEIVTSTASSPGASSVVSPPPHGISPLTKQYVVPPRPKPGRKPATDTPPTRRKAQNRAAQRAFRERRAAKVNELEDEMNELRQEHEDEIAALRQEYDTHLRETDTIYKSTLKKMSDELSSWRERYATLEASLGSGQISSITDEEAQRSYQTPPAIQDGCGNCTTDSRCQCVEDVFGVNDASEQKRAVSPDTSANQSKRLRMMESDELETDFTTFQRPLPTSGNESQLADSQIEPCGFCSDGRACLCAEIAADKTRFAESVQIKQESPGPQSPCRDGPGTCNTCKTNPTINVICRSLNASQPQQLRLPSRVSKDSAPCPLGDACCRVSNTIAASQAQQSKTESRNLNQIVTGPTLSCADAFSALSQHKAFEKASKELGQWLPLLKTVPARGNGSSVTTDKSTTQSNEALSQSQSLIAGKTGFEIEAASVLSVLQYYDTRYKNAQS